MQPYKGSSQMAKDPSSLAASGAGLAVKSDGAAVPAAWVPARASANWRGFWALNFRGEFGDLLARVAQALLRVKCVSF
jgi:hypothetical protein